MKVDIITGCDSGIGKSIVEKYIKDEIPIIYSYMETDPFNSKYAYGFPLDLRDKSCIDLFVERVITVIAEEGFQIGALFNNAGIGIGGPIEDTPLEIYRESMEINFFGLLGVLKGLLPAIVKDRGRVIIHGSMAGRVSLPFFSPYSATKHALEAVTDTLRRELKRDGVQVSIIETGGIATPIWNKVEKQDRSFITDKYKGNIEIFIKNFVLPAQRSMDPGDAAIKFIKIIRSKKLHKRYKLSKSPLRDYILILLPESLKDFIFRKMSDL